MTDNNESMDIRDLLVAAHEEAADISSSDDNVGSGKEPKEQSSGPTDQDGVTGVDTSDKAPSKAKKTKGDSVSSDVTDTKKAAASDDDRAADGKKTVKDQTSGKPEDKEAAEKAAAEVATTKAKEEAPKNWSDLDKNTFSKLDKDGQEFLLRRHKEMEADYTKKTQEIANFKADYDPVDQLLKPHEAQMKAAGFSNKAQLIGAWFNVEKALVEGKGIDIISSLVKNYRIDPQQLVAALTNPQQPQQSPPQPSATAVLPPEVLEKINKLESTLGTYEQERQQRQEQAHLDAVKTIDVQINTFKDAKDAQGQLLHPHFAEVEADMAKLAMAAKADGEVLTLDQLYDKAVWANTSTRTKILSAQQQAADKTRNEEARAKAAAAKKAGSAVQGAPGAGHAAGPKKGDLSVRQLLEEAADDYTA